MAKARFAYTNLALTATITASSELSNRPASYLKNPARWKKWRSSTTTGDQNVIFDFGSAMTVRAVAIIDWKKHGTTGTIKAEYWDGAAWQLFGTFTLPAFNPTKLAVVWNTSGQSTQKIRVYFSNVGAVSDYVELGVAITATYLEPSFNLVDGFELTPVDPSPKIEATGGEESGEARRHYFVTTGTFEHMPNTDMEDLLTMFDSVGRLTPILFAIDPDAVNKILYCTLEKVAILNTGPGAAGPHFDIRMSAREAR